MVGLVTCLALVSYLVWGISSVEFSSSLWANSERGAPPVTLLLRTVYPWVWSIPLLSAITGTWLLLRGTSIVVLTWHGIVCVVVMLAWVVLFVFGLYFVNQSFVA